MGADEIDIRKSDVKTRKFEIEMGQRAWITERGIVKQNLFRVKFDECQETRQDVTQTRLKEG